jgi:hypothetical protein
MLAHNQNLQKLNCNRVSYNNRSTSNQQKQNSRYQNRLVDKKTTSITRLTREMSQLSIEPVRTCKMYKRVEAIFDRKKADVIMPIQRLMSSADSVPIKSQPKSLFNKLRNPMDIDIFGRDTEIFGLGTIPSLRSIHERFLNVLNIPRTNENNDSIEFQWSVLISEIIIYCNPIQPKPVIYAYYPSCSKQSSFSNN